MSGSHSMQGKHSWLHFVNYLIYTSIPLTIISCSQATGDRLGLQSGLFLPTLYTCVLSNYIFWLYLTLLTLILSFSFNNFHKVSQIYLSHAGCWSSRSNMTERHVWWTFLEFVICQSVTKALNKPWNVFSKGINDSLNWSSNIRVGFHLEMKEIFAESRIHQSLIYRLIWNMNTV